MECCCSVKSLCKFGCLWKSHIVQFQLKYKKNGATVQVCKKLWGHLQRRRPTAARWAQYHESSELVVYLGYLGKITCYFLAIYRTYSHGSRGPWTPQRWPFLPGEGQMWPFFCGCPHRWDLHDLGGPPALAMAGTTFFTPWTWASMPLLPMMSYLKVLIW